MIRHHLVDFLPGFENFECASGGIGLDRGMPEVLDHIDGARGN